MEYGTPTRDGWIYLEPDAVNFRSATYLIHKPCPFCGSNAGPIIDKMRPDGGFNGDRVMYQSVIECNGCSAMLRINALTREDSQRMVSEAWNDRRAYRDRKRVETAQETGEQP